MRDTCIAIIAPAAFTGFFLAMRIFARRNRKELEALEKRIAATCPAPEGLDIKEQS